MNTARLPRTCSCPMNSDKRCGRNEASALSSSRRSGVTRRPGLALTSSSLQISSAAVLVRQKFANGRDLRAVFARNDHARLAIVVPDQFAATPTRRHHSDGLILFVGRRMTHRHDGVDPALTEIDDRTPERDRLGTHRHAAEIGIEIDADENPSRATTQGSTDFLPVVAIAPLDRRAGSLDQLFIPPAQCRSGTGAVLRRVGRGLVTFAHFANSLSPSRIRLAASASSPALRAAAAMAAA